MKKLLIIIIVLLLLVSVSAAAFVFLFDANKYKQEITELAESYTGRPITLAGDVKLSLYPWLGIQLENVTIGNRLDTKAGSVTSSFSKNDFATIERFNVSVKILPLIEKRLEIDKLILQRLSVDFEQNVQGVNNWSGIFGQSDNKSESELNGLVIGGVKVTDSQLSWFDAKTGKRFTLTSMNIDTQAYVEGKALPLKLKALAESNQPQWQASTSMEALLMFNPDSPIFRVNDLKLLLEAKFPVENMKPIDISLFSNGVVNIKKETADLRNTKLEIVGLNVSGDFNIENIFSIPSIKGGVKIDKFDAAKVAKHFNIVVPEFENPNSLKNISLAAKFKTDFESVHFNELKSKIDKSEVSGFVRVEQLNNPAPVIRYDLDVDKIVWNDYAVKKDATNSDSMLPLDFIRAVDLQGSINVAEVMIDELSVSSLKIPLRLRKSVLMANPVSMTIDDAKIRGAMELNAVALPVARASIKIDNMNATDSVNPVLLKIMGKQALVIEGHVNVSAKLRSQGDSLQAHKRSLNGSLSAEMNKTILKGVDLNHSTKKVVSDYANRNNFRTRTSYLPAYDPASQSVFNRVTATFIVSGNKISTTNLWLVSDEMNITGAGSVDFEKGYLQYRSVVDKHVKDRIDIRDKLLDHPMEYDVKGEFEKLSTQFDLAKYDLLAGRLLHIEAKARRIRAINEQRKNSW